MISNTSGSDILLKTLKEAKNKHVETGWFPTARYPADEKRGRKGGEYVAQVAFWLDIGTSKMPARPFFSEAVYGSKNQIKEAARKLMARVVRGDMDIDTALGQLGLFIEGLVIDNIKSQRYAGLSEDYARWKKQFHESPQILIDTGLLWQSLTSKVGKEE